VADPGRVREAGRTDRVGRWVVLPGAVLVTVLLVAHPILPGGRLLPTFLPWLGLAVPVLLALAIVRRHRIAVLAAVLPLIAWLGVFGARLIPDGDVPHDLVAVQHNVSDVNPDPAGTVRTLLTARPDLVALEEITAEAVPAYAAVFPAEYAHHTVHGTVALWSRHPLSAAAPLDIRPASFGTDWNRGLRAVAHTPHGDVAVYVTHLPSVRPGLTGLGTQPRDEAATKLASALVAEPIADVILLGDLNATVGDHGLRPVTSLLSTSESEFAFSFPAALPVARIDHVMARALIVTSVRALPETGSDHLPIVARLRF
jgi:vancomycin resistance protein VanJ